MTSSGKKKHITLIPIGGLANRIYTITTAILFCTKNNIELRIIWFKDWGMGADFKALFTVPKFDNVKIIDAKWYHYIYDRPRKKNLWLPRIYQKLYFGGVFTEKNSKKNETLVDWFNINRDKKKLYIAFCGWFLDVKKFANILITHSNIQKEIDSYLDSFSSLTFGIHIRRADNQLSIEKSPLSLFIKQIYKDISHYPNIKFYVASDSLVEKKELYSLFGNKIITQDNDISRNSENGIIDALIELYLLAATKKLYGSYGSTFSLLASEISNIPIVILTK